MHCVIISSKRASLFYVAAFTVALFRAPRSTHHLVVLSFHKVRSPVHVWRSCMITTSIPGISTPVERVAVVTTRRSV
jgi:hypothetical protein